MKNIKNQNRFLITSIYCILLLLLICYFGINVSTKGTNAAEENCKAGYEKHYINQNAWHIVGNNWEDYVNKYYCCPVESEEWTDPNPQYELIYVNGKIYCFDNLSRDKNGAKLPNDTIILRKNEILSNTDLSSQIGGCEVHPWDKLSSEDDQGCQQKYGSNWYYDDGQCKTAFQNCTVPAYNLVGQTTTYTATFYDYNGKQIDGTEECEVGVGNTTCDITKPYYTGAYKTNGWGTSQGCTDGKTTLTLSADTKFYACHPNTEQKACFMDGPHERYYWGSYGEIINDYYQNNNKLWHDVNTTMTEAECLNLNSNNITFSCNAYDGNTKEEIGKEIRGCQEQKESCTLKVGIDGKVEYCDIITPKAPELANYTFYGWSSNKCETIIGENQLLPFNVPGATYYYSPCYGQGSSSTQKYTIIYSYYDSKKDQPISKSVEVEAGEVYEIPSSAEITKNDEFADQLADWHIGLHYVEVPSEDQIYQPGDKITITSNLNLLARYNLEVIFNANGGHIVEDGVTSNSQTSISKTFPASLSKEHTQYADKDKDPSVNISHYMTNYRYQIDFDNINVTAEKDGNSFKGWARNEQDCQNKKYIETYTIGTSVPQIEVYACYEKSNGDGGQNEDPTNPPSSNPPTDDSLNEDNGNTTDNPQTGDTAIFIVLTIGIIAIIYFVIYYRKVKQN